MSSSQLTHIFQMDRVETTKQFLFHGYFPANPLKDGARNATRPGDLTSKRW
jgi:hypothetical protein